MKHYAVCENKCLIETYSKKEVDDKIASFDYVTNAELSNKGYLTNTELSSKDYVTNTELNNKDYVTNIELSSKNYSKKSTIKEITIYPSDWSYGVYQLHDSLITLDSNQEYLLPISTGSNNTMIETIQKANLQDAGQGNGWLKLRCLGTVPQVAITLRFIFRGD